MAKIQNISTTNKSISDLSIIDLEPGAIALRSDAEVEASADAQEYILDNNFIKITWDKQTLVTRTEFEANTSGDIIDPTALIASHAAKTTGVHGVGSETVGSKDKDTYLDKGGSNEVTAANAKDAVTKKHTQGTDQGLDTGGSNAVVVADIKDAVTKKHGQNDSNSSCDASGVAAGLFGKIVAVVSGTSAGGGGATEILTVAGLAAGDTILFVCNSTVGGTPANCIVNAFSYSSPGNLSVTWIGDPGAGAKVTVCLKKA